MKRIRIVFVALAVLLLVPIALLVQRAIDSVALERRVAHRAFAERVFDEMERELSRVLRAEEDRPASDAVFRDSRFGETDGLEDYVGGYFEVSADRRFHTGAGRSNPASGAFAALVKRALGAGPSAADRSDAADTSPAPGSSRELDRDLENSGVSNAQSLEERFAKLVPELVSPYEALQSLNKGAEMRQKRQVRRSAAPEPPVAPEAALRASVAEQRVGSSSASGAASSAARSQAAADAMVADRVESEAEWLDEDRLAAVAGPDAPRGAVDEVDDIDGVADRGIGSDSQATPATRPARTSGVRSEAGVERPSTSAARPRAHQTAPGRAVSAPTIEVHPMTGQLIDDDWLLLVRQVRAGSVRLQQGLVLQLPALVERLEASSAVGGSLASFVTPHFYVTGREPPPAEASSAYRYRHRFAEPFSALQVELVLAPLPDVAGAGPIYALAGLLLLSVTVGLLAAYRTVAVTMGFAERRSNFVAAVTHELKTPLTAIRMYSEMLRDGMVADDDKRRSYYETITAESERLSRLIDNVLEFSRLEQGTRESALVVGALGPLVESAAAILEPHAREQGFRIEVEVEPGLPAVRCDRDAVVQVVVNLIDNAIKYARDSVDRVVVIRCARLGDRVSLAVRDHGPGVANRHVGKIFEAFYRGEDELTRSAKGAGIGLALVKGLARSMGAAVVGRNLAEGGFEVELAFEVAESS